LHSDDDDDEFKVTANLRTKIAGQYNFYSCTVKMYQKLKFEVGIAVDISSA